MSSGRVDNLAVVMGLHPDYLSCFWRLHCLLLHADGPLASSWRHYIAIMVSLSEPSFCWVGHMGGFGLWISLLVLPEFVSYAGGRGRPEQRKALTLSDHPQNSRF